MPHQNYTYGLKSVGPFVRCIYPFLNTYDLLFKINVNCGITPKYFKNASIPSLDVPIHPNNITYFKLVKVQKP